MKRIDAEAVRQRLGNKVVASALLAAMTGCAAFDVADDSQWYAARVETILTSSDVDASVNRRCVDSLDPVPERVAIVTVRVHRALHYAAFAIPASAGVQVRDDVAVNFRLCQLRSGHA